MAKGSGPCVCKQNMQDDTKTGNEKYTVKTNLLLPKENTCSASLLFQVNGGSSQYLLLKKYSKISKHLRINTQITSP